MLAAGRAITFAGSREELRELLPRAEVLCSFTMPEGWQETAPNLRWLQYPGAGVDSLRASGVLDSPQVAVTMATGIHAPAISEYVFSSMLHFNWNWRQM